MKALTSGDLYRLMAWLSPSFPVGSYTYSHGLEWTVEAGLVADAASARRWIEGIMTFGTARIDADLFREAHQAVWDGDDSRFDRAVEWADCLRGSAELAMESVNQGSAFLTAVERAWPHPGFAHWRQRLGHLNRPAAYAPAVALAAAVHGVALQPSLTAYLYALSANLISAAVRLIPLGQSDGQAIQAALAPTVEQAASQALSRDWDDRGAAGVMVDVCSMLHESQYTRLFRS